MRRLHWLALTGAGVFAASAGLPACGVSDGAAPGEQAVSGSKQALQSLQAAFPSAKVESKQGRVTRVYGALLSTGATAAEAAERFRLDHASAFGAAAAELVPQELVDGRAINAATPKPLGVMFDRKTGQYKFWLFRYGQVRSGTPVFRSSLLALVKNEPNNPVVWASSTLHDLAAFSAVAPIRTALPDATKTLAAVRAGSDFNGRVLTAPARVLGTSAPELTIFAGKEGADAPPRLAIDYVAQTDGGGKFRVLADAAR